MENYLDTHIQNTGQYQTMINGNIIDNAKWALTYDGDELNLEAKNNDKAVYMNLKNDELLKLFELPAYHKTIDERLKDVLQDKNEIDIRPVIIEKLTSHKKKTTRKHKKSQHDTSYNGESRSNSKSNSKHDSRHKAHHNTITPDYLKTIY